MINEGTLKGVVSAKAVLNGTTSIPSWIVGPQGPQGEKGEQGEKGDTGESGVYRGSNEPTNPEVKVWLDPNGTADNLATEKYVDDAIAAIDIPDTTPIATKEVAGKVKPDGTTIDITTDGIISVIGDIGEDGATFIPSISSDGTISWKNDKGLPNPSSVNVKGPKGDKGNQGPTGAKGATGPKGDMGPRGATGERGRDGKDGAVGAPGKEGPRGPKGEKGDAFTYSDFTQSQLNDLKGPQGPAGRDGSNGKDGEQGPRGFKGDPFTYADFTEQQLKDLTGPMGPQGEIGPQGKTGEPGIYRGTAEPVNPDIDVWIDPSGQANDLASKKYVDDSIAAIPSPDLSAYATTVYVDDKIGAINTVLDVINGEVV